MPNLVTLCAHDDIIIMSEKIYVFQRKKRIEFSCSCPLFCAFLLNSKNAEKCFRRINFPDAVEGKKGFFFIKNRAILGLLFFILVFSAQIFNRFDSKYNLQIIGFESQSDPSTNCPKKVFVKRDLFKTSLN